MRSKERCGGGWHAVLAALAAVLAGCISDHRSDVAPVNPVEWSAGSSAVVEIDNDDTLSMRELWLLVRHNDDLPSGRLMLTVRTVAPDSTEYAERVALPVRKETGFSRPWSETEALWRSGAVLSQRGTYRFAITPVETVKGVRGVGVEMK